MPEQTIKFSVSEISKIIYVGLAALGYDVPDESKDLNISFDYATEDRPGSLSLPRSVRTVSVSMPIDAPVITKSEPIADESLPKIPKTRESKQDYSRRNHPTEYRG